MGGLSRKGCVVKKPVDTLTLRAEDVEALIAREHRSNVPRANAERVEWVSRLLRERLSFSKKMANHSRAIKYCICHDNLTRAGAWHGAHYCAGPRCLVRAREHDDRYLPRGLLLILDKNRELLRLAVEEPLAFLARRHGRPDPKTFAAEFDRGLGVCD